MNQGDPRGTSVDDWARWRDIGYLERGTPRQRRAHAALVDLGVLRDLAPFEATLVGTIPIGIDVPDSDLDIACRAADRARFEDTLVARYGGRPGFAIDCSPGPGGATVARFSHGRESIELFGQDLPVAHQAGFRHMAVEARLLALGGERLRRSVLALKLRGFKTEPAFAEVLGLSGDPYQRLLSLYPATDARLAELVGGADEA